MPVRHPAFTLVELLVVIVIIAILVALLFPVFSKVREKGRQAQCTSNLKQIAQAIMIATSEQKEVLPGEAGVEDGSKWREALSLGAGVFKCPSASLDGSPDSPAYGMNLDLCGVGQGQIRPVLSTRIVLVADGTRNTLRSVADLATTRHNNGLVAAFLDGHASYIDHPHDAVVTESGQQGSAMLLGALGYPVFFDAADSATGDEGATGDAHRFPEGAAVVLINQSSAEITASVTVTGDGAPGEGLAPGSSDLTIGKGKLRVFTLHCGTKDGEKVETKYTFGSGEQSSVTLTVAP